MTRAKRVRSRDGGRQWGQLLWACRASSGAESPPRNDGLNAHGAQSLKVLRPRAPRPSSCSRETAPPAARCRCPSPPPPGPAGPRTSCSAPTARWSRSFRAISAAIPANGSFGAAPCAKPFAGLRRQAGDPADGTQPSFPDGVSRPAQRSIQTGKFTSKLKFELGLPRSRESGYQYDRLAQLSKSEPGRFMRTATRLLQVASILPLPAGSPFARAQG